MDSRTKDVIKIGDDLFGKRSHLMSLWQEIADNFYPERADFTEVRTLGEEFAAHLNSSIPLMMRRELGDSYASMLRRQDQEWFAITIEREDRLDDAGREWLETATAIMRRAMYDRQAHFVRATKEGDHDYAAFGQTVISQEINYKTQTLLYRCWHLRDVAWCEGHDGSVYDRHHNLKPTVRWLAQQFGKDKLDPKHVRLLDKHPHTQVNCRRVVMRSDEYGEDKFRRWPWVSLYVDIDNQHCIDERGSFSPIYVIPRWETVSGSQYGYSPAVVAGLPDARLLQAMTLTLLEAGEMAVRPPLIANMDAVQGGVKMFAGGITAVDAEYDERMGDVLRPVYQEKSGLPFGIELAQMKEEALVRAFYLNKLRALPPKEMTAYEASVWLKDWIREAIPLFEPMETEYNGGLCEQTFEDLMLVNAFGPREEIPRSVRGTQVRFKFKSPLSEAIEAQKGQRLVRARELIDVVVPLDRSAGAVLDAATALREALAGDGVPAKWMRSEDEVAAMSEQMAQQEQMQQQGAAVQQGAAAVEQIGLAGKAVAEAEAAA